MFGSLLQRPNSLLNRRNRFQFLTTLIVNIITFSHGIGVGWLSPTLRRLQSDDLPLSFNVNIEEISWIGSMLGIGSVVGNVVVGLLLDRCGRKICMFSIAIPHICLWILIYCAESVEYLYVARFLGGVCGGGGYIVLPIFISEIADTNIRGTLSSMVMLSVNIGTLVGFILSSYVGYYLIPFMVVVLPITYFTLNFFLPETPHHLIRAGKYTQAEHSFKFYKNISPSGSLDEFKALKATLTQGQSLKVDGLTYRDFLTRPAIKAYITALVLLIANQFCGLFTFVNYMSDIFASSGSTLDPNTCTIVIGVVQICGVYVATLLCDICGRKILMLISTLGVAISLTCLGLFTYYAQYNDLSAFGWLPLLFMALDIFLGNVGLVGCFFVVLVEVYPAKIRSVAASCSIVLLSALVFVMLKIFPICMTYLGLPLTIWCCASTAFFGYIYFIFFLEETKGKSMVDE